MRYLLPAEIQHPGADCLRDGATLMSFSLVNAPIETVIAAGHGCHKNYQAPMPEHKRCCIASHSQQADVAVRYIAPELIDDPENAAADLSITASISKKLSTSQNSYPGLRHPGSVLRI